MRTLLLKTEATELLNEYFPDFIGIFTRSKEELDQHIESEISKGKSFIAPSYKTMNMWHNIVNEAIKVFKDSDEFKPVIINGVFGLLYNELLFIRFKKLTNKLLPSNNPTLQSNGFCAQLHIDGFPERPCIVIMGYVMNPLMTDFESINLVCTKSKNALHWDYDILNNQHIVDNELQLNVQELVSGPIEQLLKIKQTKKAKKTVNGDNGD
jgi:hypothetical protein